MNDFRRIAVPVLVLTLALTFSLGGCQRESASIPWLSDLRAEGSFPLYTTYAAAMERSGFILDEGYHFRYYQDSAGADFTTDTGGDLCLGFKLGDQWAYTTGDMYRAPVITASYPDMVRYEMYPFEGIRVDAWFVVHSSTAALLDIRLENEMGHPMDFTVVPFMRAPGTGFGNVDATDGIIRFEHQELPDKWTLNHGVPYADSIRNVFLLSVEPDAAGADTTGVFAGTDPGRPTGVHSPGRHIPGRNSAIANALTAPLSQETPSAAAVAFIKRMILDPDTPVDFRLVRVVDTLNGRERLEETARGLLTVPLAPYQQANEQRFSQIRPPVSDDPEKIALYWSAVNMMRQVFYPAEGRSDYNYYVFSREPTWGWGHGGQVFHESMTMLAYAAVDPQSAMNSQRVYSSRQYPNGYINYRSGSYLDEIIEYKGELTSSAPWYAWQNWELYKLTGDREFLREMYSSSRKFYEFYIANRDKDQDGLCEWGGHAILESVRDSEVAVWDEVGWPAEFEGLDLNCMLVKEAKSLEAMAAELGLDEDARKWRADYEKRTALINQTFWDQENGFYYHVDKETHTFTHTTPDDLKRDEIIGFLPLWAGVASEEQAALLVRKLTDPEQFWRPFGVPSLSAADSYYNPKGYWNGPVWVEWDFLIMEGLLDYGYIDQARELVDRVSRGMVEVLKKDHTLWEFYSPDEAWGGHHQTYIWAGIINRMMERVAAADSGS